MLGGCATPSEYIARVAGESGFTRLLLPGDLFRHVAFHRPGDRGPVLHVYLEHDGTPFIDNRWVAADPTPRRPVALELARLDRAPVLYLGRPCHHGLAGDAPCTPQHWTHRRYAPEVVASLAAATRRSIASAGYSGVVLIGHSGGGTLATLMAWAMPEALGVVTLGANLDVAAWAKHHGYSPLDGSLDPATMPGRPLPFEIHLAGADDDVVPPASIARYRARNPRAQIRVLPQADHLCCWKDAWPAMLDEIARLAP